MKFSAAFLIFIIGMVLATILGINMILPLLLGYFLFASVAIKQGITVKALMDMTFRGVKKSLVVVKIMLCIGILTAMWRAGGTILFFVYYGVDIITPKIFVLAAFVLPLILSYAIGTSFGVSSTMGIILMTIARASGANIPLTTGAILSGVYFGDRCSPASSSASLTAIMTGTDLYTNVKLMHKTGLPGVILSLVLYGVLSYLNPISAMDTTTIEMIESQFNVSWVTVLPAVAMLILPLIKVPVYISMLISAAMAFVCAVWLQDIPAFDVIKACVLGMSSDGSYLGELLQGGGLKSMMDICIILLISCSYSSIFDETDMLAPVNSKIEGLIKKIGRFPAVCIVSIFACAIFCNQTIAVIVVANLMSKAFKESGGTNQEFCIDIENSGILFAGLVPWCIACSVPINLMGGTFAGVPYAFMLYLIPLTYFFTKKKYFPMDRKDVE